MPGCVGSNPTRRFGNGRCGAGLISPLARWFNSPRSHFARRYLRRLEVRLGRKPIAEVVGSSPTRRFIRDMEVSVRAPKFDEEWFLWMLMAMTGCVVAMVAVAVAVAIPVVIRMWSA